MELPQVQATAEDESYSSMNAVGLSSPFELSGGETFRKDDRSAPSAMRFRSHIYGLTPERKENKAAREKLRRNELNEKFITLGNMLGVKSDKVSILNQSMFCIQSLQRENEQIKNDNIKMKAENTALLGLLKRVLPASVAGKDFAAIAHVLPSLMTPTEYHHAFGSLEDEVSAVLHPPVA
uniref:BHLH domain-containing protein n=1 Tax=Cyanoptyche gloeocystis TaxID=77922 RepID=A0A7S2NMG4_9EUKA